MKLKAVCLSLIILFTSRSVLADESAQKNYSVSVKNLNGLYIRKSLSETTMIYAGIGLYKGQQYYASDFGFGAVDSTTNYTTYNGAVGARKYLTNEKLSKFINLEIGRYFYKDDNSSTTGGPSYDAQAKSTAANITYGIEYFISSNVSIEGAAGIGMYWSEGTTSSGTYTNTKGISLPLASIALTYYW
jgi:hypothetical protein